MELLTVICLDGDAGRFRTGNEKFLKEAEQRGVRAAYYTEGDLPGKHRFERFCDALSDTRSKYYCFANDATVFTADGLGELLQALAEDVAPFYALCLNKQVDVTKCSSILDMKYPLFLPRYIFSRSFLEAACTGIEEGRYFEETLLVRAADEDFRMLGYTVSCTDDSLFEAKAARYGRAFDKAWYTEELTSFMIPLLKTRPSAEVQRLLLYMIWLRFWANRDSSDKKLLAGGELEDFYRTADEALSMIEKDAFTDRHVLKRMKAEDSCFLYSRISPDADICASSIGGEIHAINMQRGGLLIDCSIYNDVFDLPGRGSVRLTANGKELPIEDTGIEIVTCFFGERAIARRIMQARIPLAAGESMRFEVQVKTADGYVRLPLRFRGMASRLTEKSGHSYCVMDGWLLRYRDKGIVISGGRPGIKDRLAFRRDVHRLLGTGSEAEDLRRLWDRCMRQDRGAKGRPVWIFFDKIYKGGDNGEYLFRYAFNNVGYADSYYIIRNDAAEYGALKAEFGDHILAFNTTEQRLRVLQADIIFATHPKAYRYCGFDRALQECFRCMLRARVVCIQHGLTIQDLPGVQNRLVDNTQAYFCASEIEMNNLRQSMYGYKEEELHLTGLPRYDGLRSNDKKQILIAPTWRRDIMITGNKVGDSKAYNKAFKETVYYKIYNDLICNERLIACARETGYSIIYLLHPTIGVQKRDFEQNGYAVILDGSSTSYDPVLAESSLMVTDYSGVQFDFAYMMKPVIYYHPEELPPQYGNSHFSYERDGFGPVTGRQEELIDLLCSHMRSGCVMPDEYKKRAETFFAYTDQNNCARICDVIKKEFYPE